MKCVRTGWECIIQCLVCQCQSRPFQKSTSHSKQCRNMIPLNQSQISYSIFPCIVKRLYCYVGSGRRLPSLCVQHYMLFSEDEQLNRILCHTGVVYLYQFVPCRGHRPCSSQGQLSYQISLYKVNTTPDVEHMSVRLSFCDLVERLKIRLLDFRELQYRRFCRMSRHREFR